MRSTHRANRKPEKCSSATRSIPNAPSGPRATRYSDDDRARMESRRRSTQAGPRSTKASANGRSKYARVACRVIGNDEAHEPEASFAGRPAPTPSWRYWVLTGAGVALIILGVTLSPQWVDDESESSDEAASTFGWLSELGSSWLHPSPPPPPPDPPPPPHPSPPTPQLAPQLAPEAAHRERRAPSRRRRRGTAPRQANPAASSKDGRRERETN